MIAPPPGWQPHFLGPASTREQEPTPFGTYSRYPQSPIRNQDALKSAMLAGKLHRLCLLSPK